jgi:hypothetical protein
MINFCDIEDDRYEGDPRRCPRHPRVITSSADGLHDGVCGKCEHESYLRELEHELADAVTCTPDDEETEELVVPAPEDDIPF